MKILKIIVIMFLTISIVFLSGYALSTVPEFSRLNIPCLIIIFMILVCLILLQRRKIQSYIIENKFSLRLLILMIFQALISTVFNPTSVNINSFLYYSLLITVAFLFTATIKFRSFVHFFLKIMTLVAIIALIGFIITDIIGYNPPFSLIKNVNGTVYQNGIIWFRIKYASYSSRLMGIFWEPGLFASFSTIALLLLILNPDKKRNMLKKIIFIVSLIFSQSTAGLLLLILCLIILSVNISGYKKYFSILILVVLATLVLFSFNDIYNFLINTGLPIFQKLDINVDTTSARLNSFLINIRIFKSSPIIGFGLGETNIIFNDIANNKIAQTSTSAYFMASFGFLGIIFTLVFIIAGVNIGIHKKSALISIILPVIIIFILNKEPHSLFLCDYIFMFYLVKMRRRI